MMIISIIGIFLSGITFILLHPNLDKELKNRVIYIGGGGVAISILGFVVSFTGNFYGIYYLFQFLFLFLGLLHLFLIFKFKILGDAFLSSLFITTFLTITLLFLGIFGFQMVLSKLVKNNINDASCVFPFIIPFFVYQTYKLWGGWMPTPRFEVIIDPSDHDHGDESYSSSTTFVKVKFRIPKKYIGISGVKGLLIGEFPVDWQLSKAFCKTVSFFTSRDSNVKLDEDHLKILSKRALWVFYLREGFFKKKYLDASQSLFQNAINDDILIHVKRLRNA